MCTYMNNRCNIRERSFSIAQVIIYHIFIVLFYCEHKYIPLTVSEDNIVLVTKQHQQCRYITRIQYFMLCQKQIEVIFIVLASIYLMIKLLNDFERVCKTYLSLKRRVALIYIYTIFSVNLNITYQSIYCNSVLCHVLSFVCFTYF